MFKIILAIVCDEGSNLVKLFAQLTIQTNKVIGDLPAANTNDTGTLDPSTADKIGPTQIDAPQIQPAQIDPTQIEPAQIEPAEIEPAEIEPAEICISNEIANIEADTQSNSSNFVPEHQNVEHSFNDLNSQCDEITSSLEKLQFSKKIKLTAQQNSTPVDSSRIQTPRDEDTYDLSKKELINELIINLGN